MKPSGMIPLAAGLLSLLGACQTPPPYSAQDDAVKTFSSDGVVVRAEFLPESELRTRFGTRVNPFLSPPPGILPDRHLVFEVTVTATDDPLLVIPELVELQFAARLASPVTAFTYENSWTRQASVQDMTYLDRSAGATLIRENLPPARYEIPSGSERTYLFLFRGDLPQYGEARLFIPILGANERPVTRAELAYEF